MSGKLMFLNYHSGFKTIVRAKNIKQSTFLFTAKAAIFLPVGIIALTMVYYRRMKSRKKRTNQA